MMISLDDYANSLQIHTLGQQQWQTYHLRGGLKWQPFGFNLRDAKFLGGKTSDKRIYAGFLAYQHTNRYWNSKPMLTMDRQGGILWE